VSAHIKAISYYLPEKILTNEELSVIFPQYTPEEIYKRTGVLERHISGDSELPSDMAIHAFDKLISEHGIKPEEIDFLIFCSMIPDRMGPATSSILQEKLQLPKHSGGIDLPMGCSGYVYALALANSLIVAGTATNVLILAGDCTTKTVEESDHTFRFILGDAMSASVISRSPDNQIGAFLFGTDGSGADALIIRGENAKEKVNAELKHDSSLNKTMPFGKFYMDGTGVLSLTLKNIPPMINEMLVKEGLSIDDIDMFVFHQAGSFMLEKLRKKLEIPTEKFFSNNETKGNTSSATIPIALYDALKAGSIKKGSKVLLAGYGIGFSWGCTIVTI